MAREPLDVTNFRAVNYRFFCLSHTAQLRALLDLGLLDDNDHTGYGGLHADCAKRAVERGQVEELGYRVLQEERRAPFRVSRAAIGRCTDEISRWFLPAINFKPNDVVGPTPSELIEALIREAGGEVTDA